jgi:hypothetical protein
MSYLVSFPIRFRLWVRSWWLDRRTCQLLTDGFYTSPYITVVSGKIVMGRSWRIGYLALFLVTLMEGFYWGGCGSMAWLALATDSLTRWLQPDFKILPQICL